MSYKTTIIVRKQKVITPHSKNCRMSGVHTWATGVVSRTYYGTSAGNLSKSISNSYVWLVFPCNDPQCTGEKAINLINILNHE